MRVVQSRRDFGRISPILELGELGLAEGHPAKSHDASSPNPAIRVSALVRAIAGPMALDFLLMS